MRRPPLPAAMRSDRGAFAEAVLLLFRIETLELAALLVAASFALAVGWETLRLRPEPVFVPFGWIRFDPVGLARGFLYALLLVAAVLLLVPVADGDRGLRPRLLSTQFGALAVAAAVLVGFPEGLRVARWAAAMHLDWPSTALDWKLFWFGMLPLALTVWAAWFLGNTVRRGEGRGASRKGLLAWPGLLIAVPLGAFVSDLGRELILHPRVPLGHPYGPGFKAILLLGWALAHLLAALWMLRAVENEAEPDPPPGR